MASLNHVCMWSDIGWTRITAEEAAELYPLGTVSAHSGLFMCELCGQYVTLTSGYVNERHFRHSSYEESKDCPERTSGDRYLRSYDSQEHELPFRITNVSTSSFGFEIGLIQAPIRLASKDLRIIIKPKGSFDECYEFSKERIKTDGITYLPVGDSPYEKYTLDIKNGNNILNEFWPKEINGVNSKGSLFEKESGKRLTYDADVEVGKEYYLLKCGRMFLSRTNGIQIKMITQKQINWKTWTLYVVSASTFNENSARFYLNFHCRLTEHPVSLQPVWPLFVEGNYILKHNQNRIYMLVQGNIASVKTFPDGTVYNPHEIAFQTKLYEISCSGRQQLISAGRTGVLQYTYFWREPLYKEGLRPKVFVTDINGVEVVMGETEVLPKKKTLCFKSAFDGELIISKDGYVVDKRKLYADKHYEINELTYGLNVQVIIGFDLIWQICFKKHQKAVDNNDNELMKQIINVSGTKIPAPHSLRNILCCMNRYPKVCQWIRKCINDGYINEQSYRKLQETYFNMNSNR